MSSTRRMLLGLVTTSLIEGAEASSESDNYNIVLILGLSVIAFGLVCGVPIRYLGHRLGQRSENYHESKTPGMPGYRGTDPAPPTDFATFEKEIKRLQETEAQAEAKARAAKEGAKAEASGTPIKNENSGLLTRIKSYLGYESQPMYGTFPASDKKGDQAADSKAAEVTKSDLGSIALTFV